MRAVVTESVELAAAPLFQSRLHCFRGRSKRKRKIRRRRCPAWQPAGCSRNGVASRHSIVSLMVQVWRPLTENMVNNELETASAGHLPRYCMTDTQDSERGIECASRVNRLGLSRGNRRDETAVQLRSSGSQTQRKVVGVSQLARASWTTAALSLGRVSSALASSDCCCCRLPALELLHRDQSAAPRVSALSLRLSLSIPRLGPSHGQASTPV